MGAVNPWLAGLARAAGQVAPGFIAELRAALGASESRVRGKRNYDGAKKGRSLGGWRTTNTDADSTIAPSLSILRSRSRDLVRNNPHATRGVQVLVGSLVGTGVTPRSATGDVDLDKRVDGLFERWSSEVQTEGDLDFYGLQALACRALIESGEVLIRKRVRRLEDGLTVPLQLQILEADHLDSTRNENLPNGGKIVQGIEFDPVGRRAAYWLFPDHPGSSLGTIQTSSRIPADEILHLFEPLRPGQTRGVPWMAPIVGTLQGLGEYRSAHTLRKKLEACYLGVVTRNDVDAPDGATVTDTVTDANGDTVEAFEPGMFLYAPGNISWHEPKADGGYVPFEESQLRAVAAGLRMPYELLTGDLSKVNFSSSRVGLNEFKRFVEQLQWQCLIPQFLTPIRRWFIEIAIAVGSLPAGVKYATEWQPPAWMSVNPQQDANTDALEVRNGFATLSSKIASRGYNPRAVLEERRRDDLLLDSLGLSVDSDPRETKQAVMP